MAGCGIYVMCFLFPSIFFICFQTYVTQSLQNLLERYPVVMDEEVSQAVKDLQKEWDQTIVKTQENIRAIESCGNSGRGTEDVSSLPRLNAASQDGLSLLRSMQFKLNLLAPQLPTVEESESANLTLNFWEEQYKSLNTSLRRANQHAKVKNRKTLKEERKLLLGGGEESTVRRHNLQTKMGITSAAESITDSLRRTRQLMAQEVERSANTLLTSEESVGVLRKADSEYKGHKSLLMRTRKLLSTMRRQDVTDRVIMVIGFLLFTSAVLYVVSKRVGLLKLQRKLASAIKAGSIGREAAAGVDEIQRLVAGAMNHGQAQQVPVPDVRIPMPHVYDEL